MGRVRCCRNSEKREYLGHTINFKARKHFKDKKSHYVDENEWTIFENTHDAIIDQEIFDNVQRIRGNSRRYPDGYGEAAPLTGPLYCADCGGKMYVHRTNNGERISQYTCGQYSKTPVGVLCPTRHRINESAVLDLISGMLQAISDFAKSDRAAFSREVQEAQASQQDIDIRKNGGGWQRHRNEPENWNGLCVKFMKMYVVKGKADHLAKYNIAAAHLWQK